MLGENKDEPQLILKNTPQNPIAKPQPFKAPVRQVPVWCAGPPPLRGARAGEALFAAPILQHTVSFDEPLARATRRRACKQIWHLRFPVLGQAA